MATKSRLNREQRACPARSGPDRQHRRTALCLVPALLVSAAIFEITTTH